MADAEDDGIPESCSATMAALPSDRWRLFVMNFVLTGNAAESYRRAGYNVTSDQDAARSGYRLMRDSRIQAAIMEESLRWFRAAAPAAVKAYHDVLTDKNAKHADKLRAADAVMARVDPIQTAHRIEVQHEHQHRHHLTADQITRRIAELAAEVGVSLPAIEAQVIDVVAGHVDEVPE
jgi:phage terminase small subunit